MLSSVRTVGRYELLSELGRGAMGVVYKARDPKIDRLVAIKTISVFANTPEQDGEFRERLFTEARAAGRLSHPGIVTVYDVAEDPDTLNPYIVMEYVAGDSLEKKVSESAERLPLASTLLLVEQVAESLDYAHSQGIVHRDIKPANIIVAENGTPKITDFGIAKFNFGHFLPRSEAMGTPAFMSPEQLNGEPVDGRSDLFSLGVVLYTLLTGYRPFQGNSALTISFKVVNRNPLPATAFDSAFPPKLDHVISRAMAKDPAQRYATGREMAAEVRELRETVGQVHSSETGSFDSVYVQSATGLVNKVPSPDAAWLPIQAGKRPPAKFRWKDWRHLSAGLFALALIGTSLAVLRYERRARTIQTKAVAPSVSTGVSSESRSDISRPPQKSMVPSANTQSKRGEVATQRVPRQKAATHQIKPAVNRDATLRLRIEDQFDRAEVFIWVDDELSYHHTVDGTTKKKLVVFKGVEGYQSDSIHLTVGEHRLRVRMHAMNDSYDQSSTISGKLPGEGERQLLIQGERHKPLRLTLQ